MMKKSRLLLAVCLIAAVVALVAVPVGKSDAQSVSVGSDVVLSVPTGTLAPVASLTYVRPDRVKSTETQVMRVSDRAVIETTDGYFRPETDGEYRVSYSVSFEDGTKTDLSYVLTATHNATPVWTKNASLPYAFVSGATYDLTGAVAYDYSDGKSESAVSVTATANGESVAVTGGKFVAPNADEVTLVYRAAAKPGGTDAVKTVVMPIAKVDYNALDMRSLFVTESVKSVVAEQSSIKFTVGENAAIKYANIVSADARIAFTIPSDSNVLDGVKVTLVDSEDESIGLEFLVKKGATDSNYSLLSVNGGADLKIGGSFFGVGNYDFVLDFNNNNRTLKDATGSTLTTISKSANGKTFTGFPSGAVKLSMEAVGVSGNATINLKSINYQTMSSRTVDEVGPSLRFGNDFTFEAETGKEFTIVPPAAHDVLDPNVKLFITVMGQDGVVSDVNGKNLLKAEVDSPVTFLATKSGSYTVTFACEDSSGNAESVRRIISARPFAKPVITLDKTIGAAKKGEKVTLPKISVTTADGDEAIVYIVMYRPDGGQDRPQSGETYTFDQSGTYFFRISAYDAYFNSCTREIAITVQ